MAKLFPKVFEVSYLSSSKGWTSLLAPHPHQHLAFSFFLIIFFVDSINSEYVLILFSCFQIFIFFYQSIGFEWYLINMKLIIYLYNYGLYSSFINGCLFLTIFSIFLLFVLAHTYIYIYRQIHIYTEVYYIYNLYSLYILH